MFCSQVCAVTVKELRQKLAEATATGFLGSLKLPIAFKIVSTTVGGDRGNSPFLEENPSGSWCLSFMKHFTGYNAFQEIPSNNFYLKIKSKRKHVLEKYLSTGNREEMAQ